MNLLLVDDEIIAIKGIKAGIDWSSLPFDEILSATSAEEARSYFEKQTIDIMLCDIEMPDEDGLSLLKWVRMREYRTECIFLTCHDEFDFAKKALQLKGMDYLLKPVPYKQLEKILMDASEKVKERYIEEKYIEYGRERIEEIAESSRETRERIDTKKVAESVKQYIRQHYMEDISAESLGKQVYLSADYLFRIFKKEMHTTPGEYILEVRMFNAGELLKQTDLSVARVAISVGYNNYSYFTKIFKKYYGITPRQYRRKYQ